jgi:hypothetical protein
MLGHYCLTHLSSIGPRDVASLGASVVPHDVVHKKLIGHLVLPYYWQAAALSYHFFYLQVNLLSSVQHCLERRRRLTGDIHLFFVDVTTTVQAASPICGYEMILQSECST